MDADLTGADLVFDLLERFYIPARAGEEARRMSTTEIFESLSEHAPKLFSTTDVYTAMHERGFITELIGDEVKWLVRGR